MFIRLGPDLDFMSEENTLDCFDKVKGFRKIDTGSNYYYDTDNAHFITWTS